ncbi:hypothetical protein FGO68_gene5914 [Halteria grandinella]|uniref:Uncharacterized protein n=1 Tax=Halteria grandinella TaxID=5974 RepID=A0A8J8SU48_HALGN|nr:hypothetical protein FGO68_gene5914 [Halteria grandinella]
MQVNERPSFTDTHGKIVQFGQQDQVDILESQKFLARHIERNRPHRCSGDPGENDDAQNQHDFRGQTAPEDHGLLLSLPERAEVNLGH